MEVLWECKEGLIYVYCGYNGGLTEVYWSNSRYNGDLWGSDGG